MTATFRLTRKRRTAVVTFGDDEVMVYLDGCQVRFANSKPVDRRRRFYPCRAHVVHLFDLAAASIQRWKLERETQDLAAEKDRPFPRKAS